MFRLKQSRMRSRIRSKKFHCQMDAMFVFQARPWALLFTQKQVHLSLVHRSCIVYNACHVAYVACIQAKSLCEQTKGDFAMMKHLASSLAVLPLLPPVWLHHHPDACTLGDLGASQSDRGRTFPRACTSRAVAVQLILLQPSTLGTRCFDCCSAKMTLVAAHY